MVGTWLLTLTLVTLLVGVESGCSYNNSTRNFYCTNIKEFPKDINENATAVRIKYSELSGSTFENITTLPKNVRILEIDKSTLKGLAFENIILPINIRELRISNSNISYIGVFQTNEKLQVLKIFNGNKDKLRIESGAFGNLNGLLNLDLRENNLDSFPIFNQPHNTKLEELHLGKNNIKELKANQANLPNLETLDLRYNPIKNIATQAFKELRKLENLVLDGTEIEELPTAGLINLRNLSLKYVETLRIVPEGLPSLRKVAFAASKSFMCCTVYDKNKPLNGPRTLIPHNTTHTILPPITTPTPLLHTHRTIPTGFGKRKRRQLIFTLPPRMTPNTSIPIVTPMAPTPPECTPEPTAFQPCENIMGADWLTAVSFIIAPFALCGNFVVIVVFLCLARNYNVSRFVITNLAVADMSMGIYLLSLVIKSVITSGEYYNHVVSFQYGLGCKVLGFLAMFSSELSVFSLTLITVERYMTIVYAMYPKRKMTMRTAIVCMAFFWIVAITVGLLPIFGVGSYGKVAVCLPFDTANGGDVYLFFIFGVNGVCFIFICVLYAQIYRSVFKPSNSTPTRGHDSRVARRMAVLVFTDFLCFAPIAIVGLSALFDHALIDVATSKYLLVFLFPLNGLLNPFLYAIITKTFRRDLAALLKNCFVCGGTLTNYLSTLPARSVQSTNDVLSPSARPSVDFNSMDLRSLGNIRGSRENPISGSFSKSEPNLVKFSQE